MSPISQSTGICHSTYTFVIVIYFFSFSNIFQVPTICKTLFYALDIQQQARKTRSLGHVAYILRGKKRDITQFKSIYISDIDKCYAESEVREQDRMWEGMKGAA